MSISQEAIINQMIKQLKRAKHDKKDFLKHIYHVQGLCELIIEEGNITTKQKQEVNENMAKLLESQTKVTSQPQIEDKDSIFEF